MITKDQLVKTVEVAINSLVQAFVCDPYLFYTENDLHCFLYHEMLNRLPIEELACRTKDGRQSFLLHKEYPTKLRYSAKGLCEKGSGARGHFDLCFWNPEETENRLFRVQNSTDFMSEQQTFLAMEFDLIEGNRNLDSAFHHFKWDLLKLRKNEVEHGYQLVFARDWINKGDFLYQAKIEAKEVKNVSILYIEANGASNTVQAISPRAKTEFPNFSEIKREGK
jgi:hypothetical protein